MAQLEQPSATVNGQTPKVLVPESETTRPTHAGPLLLAGALALVIGAGAYVYYQTEPESDTAAVTAQAPTSGNAASAPAESTPPGAEGTVSSTPSTKPLPQDASRARAIAGAAPSAQPAKTRHVAKATKPAAAIEARDRQVALATAPKPTYPVQALRAHEQGTVLVLAQVNVDGQVTDARVVGGSGSRILDRAAPKEVRGWKFDPALHNGRPVVASIEVPVNYRLNQ